MLDIFALSAILSTGLSLILTPLVMQFAFAVGAIDKPDERKIHKRPMPRLGGLASFGSFMITLIVLHIVLPQARLDGLIAQSGWPIIAISSSAILLLGVCDDIWSLGPAQKFFVQCIAGGLVYAAGFRITSITDPFSGGVHYFGLLSLPFTVLWVVGITNAFNLIDGLDGLAAGIGMIAALTISAIALLHHDITTAVISFTLAGAVLGFLRYNFNPAKIFLGDSGSLFLGFSLAILSIQSSTKGSTAFSVIVPLLALGVPIVDTSLAMLRRVLRSFLVEQPGPSSFLRSLRSMFKPDRRHIHHQLLARGLSHRNAVFVLYLVSSTLGLCAFLVTSGSLNASLILVGVGLAAAIAVRKLGYREMAPFRNGLLLRLYRKRLLRSLVLQVFLDVFSVIAALLLAYVLTAQPREAPVDWEAVALPLIIVCLIQLAVFFLGGLYRRSITVLGLGDILQILKAISAGTIASAFALSFFLSLHQTTHLNMFVLLDFYFVATFIVGSRGAFHAMNYIFHREVSQGKKVLIYGAGNNGLLTLQSLLSTDAPEERNGVPVSPIGFLDDDPDMEGKVLDGYPVFGGHWKLEGLLNRMEIGELVIADPTICSEAFLRVKKIADVHNVPIRISELKIEPVGRKTESWKSKGHSPEWRGFTPKAA